VKNSEKPIMPEVTIDPARFAAIDLKKGSHGTPDEGMCLMEATAFLVGERHSDNPQCVSPVLGTFGRNLNDVLPDDLRQDLKGLIPSLPGTADDGWDARRSYLALDWLIRTWLPAWLELSPSCREDARTVRALGRIVDVVSAHRAGPVVREALRHSAAAGAAAGAGAWDAARIVVRDSAWDAAREAAGTIAWDATGAVASAAARAAHGVVAEIVHRGVAEDVVVPAVRELQLSAINLYTEMITSGPSGPDGRPRAEGCSCPSRVEPTRHRRERRWARPTTRTPRPTAKPGSRRSSLVARGRGVEADRSAE
jgi:hypothetical protein